MPLIPGSHRRAVFEHIHALSHAGTRATTRLVSSRFVWPGLAAYIKEWCRECTACQRAKVTSQPASQPATPVEKMEIPQQRFSHVHVDLVGPLPTSRASHRYLLTAIDYSTRWFEAVPLVNISAEACRRHSSVAGWPPLACRSGSLPTGGRSLHLALKGQGRATCQEGGHGVGGSPPLGSFGVACSPKGREGNLSSRSNARSAAGGAGPGARAARGGSTSRPRAPGSHPGHQKVLCRGDSFTSSPLDTVDWVYVRCAAGLVWAAASRQLSGPLPRARERTEDFPAPAGRAGGLHV